MSWLGNRFGGGSVPGGGTSGAGNDGGGGTNLPAVLTTVANGAEAVLDFIGQKDFTECMSSGQLSACPGAIAAVVPVGKAKLARPGARLLGKALELVGLKKLAGQATHHIVALNAKGAITSRAILERYGIGLGEAINRVHLPANRMSVNPTGAAVHSTLHTADYYAAVTAMLSQATSRAEVEAILLEIRSILLSGGFR